MKFQENYSLKHANTFRVDVSAKYFVEVSSENQLHDVLTDEKFKKLDKIILGEGANILFTKDFLGVVIRMKIDGIRIVEEDENYVFLEIGAGVNWHKFVMFAVEKGWGGVENMVYIPGTIGAAAVQNIAAYGQNLSEVFVKLKAVEINTGKKITFNKSECEFEYRNSRFKTREKDKYAVVSITLKLNKKPDINTSYFETGKTISNKLSLQAQLENIKNPSVKDVALAVMEIRKNKLPDIKKVGTAGSFFKNPVVTQEKYQKLKKIDKDLQCYPVDGLKYVDTSSLAKEKFVKIPAARLLDNIGWKGKRIGNVGTHPTQALAVVNYGANALEILEFTNQMKQAVYDNYGVNLEPEVLIV